MLRTARHLRDVLRIADPDLARFRMGARAVLAAVTTTLVLVGLARLVHVPATLALLGINISVIGVLTPPDITRRDRLVTYGGLAAAALLATIAGTALAAHRFASSIVFAGVIYGAVAVRRYGPRGVSLGMAPFIAYFMALFFHVPFRALPVALVGLVVGLAIGYVVRHVVIADRPVAITRRLRANLCTAIDVALAQLARNPDGRAATAALRRVNEVALVLDTHLDSPLAGIVAAVSVERLRAYVFEAEVSLERYAVALRMPSSRKAQRIEITRRDLDAARDALHAAPIERATVPRIAPVEPAAPTPGMHPTTRQAIQASIAGVLAMIAGSMISTTRWYWAVIAAFVVFTRTTSRGETLVRGLERVVGTAIGVLAGVWLGTVMAGHSIAELGLVFASVFIAYYFVQATQIGLAVGLTLMLAALYGVLGRFTPGLLYLRLIETAAGCIIGAGVAMFVLPASTHGQVRDHVNAVLEDLAELLERRFVPGTRPLRDRARLVDRRIRDLRTASRPLLAVAERTRHVVHLVAAAWYFARHLSLRAATPMPEPARVRLEALARDVAANARVAANGGIAAGGGPAVDHTDAIERARAEIDEEGLLSVGPASPRAALDWLGRIDRVLVELALLTREKASQDGARGAHPHHSAYARAV